MVGDPLSDHRRIHLIQQLCTLRAYDPIARLVMELTQLFQTKRVVVVARFEGALRQIELGFANADACLEAILDEGFTKELGEVQDLVAAQLGRTLVVAEDLFLFEAPVKARES